VFSQLDYAVSSGTQAFAPLASPPAAQQVDLAASADSPLYGPAGFAFDFGGVTYTEFQIHRPGVVTLGSAVAVKPAWTSAASQQRMLAPFHHDLACVAGSRVAWEFQAGVLTVEWLNLEDALVPTSAPVPSVFSFQVLLDTASGDVEFRYGARGGSTYFMFNGVFTAALTGLGDATGKTVMPWTLAGYVGANGQFTYWPADAYIRFTPTGATGSAPTVAVSHAGIPLAHGGTLTVAKGMSVANLSLQLEVDDADADPASLSALALSPDLAQSEFESAQAAVPYTLRPSSGTISTYGEFPILLMAGDGVNGYRVFEFVLYLPSTPGGGSNSQGGKGGNPSEAEKVAGTILGTALKSGAACSGIAGAGGNELPAAMFGLLLVARIIRRRRRCPA
jgi:hypothetical protein